MVLGLKVYILAFVGREVGRGSVLSMVLMAVELITIIRRLAPRAGVRLVKVASGERWFGRVLLILLTAGP